MIASDDVWAAYTEDGERGIAFHWDGAAWTVFAAQGSSRLQSVSASGPDDVWFVGFRTITDGGGPQFVSYAGHWDGAAWTPVALPQAGTGANFLNAVSVVSPTDAWAVGRRGGMTDGGEPTSETLALHWDGVSWSVVASDSPGTSSNDLWGIDALGGGDLMAVGDIGGIGSLETQPLALVPAP